MCGICGIINFNLVPVPKNTIEKMMKSMKHRGPDDEGVFIDDNIGMGHVRLSIIDLSSAGHQPMFCYSKRYCITYNGEIYNYIELKKELQYHYKFRTNTDTEVILYAYIHWGEACLKKFNGMFAFVIYDTQTKRIFAARDRFGVKPFYYSQDSNCFIFASDIPPIRLVKKCNNGPNDKVIYDYLIFGRTDHLQDTFYSDIKKLQHGHYIVIEGNKIQLKQWYSISNIENHIEPVSDFKELLTDSIKLRLRSDVPLGVCLSGGLDSSSIVCLLSKYFVNMELKTFSAVYAKNDRADESVYIKSLEKYISEMHFTTPTIDSFCDDLPNLMKAHSEPFSTTAIYAQFKVMERARDHVKVLLDGQGADEYLAGYHYFYGQYFKELLFKIAIIKLFEEVICYWHNNKSIYALGAFFYFLLPPSVMEYFSVTNKSFLRKDFINSNKKSDIVYSLFKSQSLTQSLYSHFEYKLEHLLKWEDRNSMWFSLESRVPFLDYRLVEYAINLPNQWKIEKGINKVILRKALMDVLPPLISMRNDKIGFATPESLWLRSKKFDVLFKEVIHSGSLNDRGYYYIDSVNKYYSDFIDKKHNDSSTIWRIFNLEYWLTNQNL